MENFVQTLAIRRFETLGVDFDSLEGALNIKFKDKGLLVHAITHASLHSSGVSSYELAQNFPKTVKSQ
ncbi:Endoribonuclease Dicer-like 1 [Fagus crenata]